MADEKTPPSEHESKGKPGIGSLWPYFLALGLLLFVLFLEAVRRR